MTVRHEDDNQRELWIFVDHWVPEHGSPSYLSGVVNTQQINMMCLCITFCVCQINHPEHFLYYSLLSDHWGRDCRVLRVSRSELNTAAASHQVAFSSSFNVSPTSCCQTRPVSAGWRQRDCSCSLFPFRVDLGIRQVYSFTYLASSGGRAGRLVIGRSPVQIPGSPSCLSKCPLARCWTPNNSRHHQCVNPMWVHSPLSPFK